MSISRDLNCLDKRFRELVDKWLEECKKAGLNVLITETCRSRQVQEAYYQQGRKPLAEVNELRRKAGLPPITEQQNKNPITWTMESPHLYGFAIDFVPLVNGKQAWDRSDLFKQAGEIAERLGLEWGGRWKDQYDPPHIQMRNWRQYVQKR